MTSAMSRAVLLLSLAAMVAGQARKKGDLTWNALTHNALTYNSLIGNALNFNSLNFNSLSFNALTSNSLIANALTQNALAGNSLTTNSLSGNGLTGNSLTNNALTGNSLTNNALIGNALTSNSFTNNALTSNAIVANALVANAFAANSLTYNALTANRLTANSITMNAITLNALTYNAVVPNAIVANAILANALVINALTSNGLTDEEEATICFDVTNYNASLENCDDGTTHSLKNGTFCFNVTAEPLNVTDNNCNAEQCPITAQELALLVISSLDNTTSNNEPASRPLVRLSELAASPLRGDSLPANVSLILGGAGGQTAEKLMVELLNYTTSCALGSDQSLTIQVENTIVVLNGSLGLAPNWARQRIAANDQERVSACLAARLNFFGVHVELSLRGTTLGHPSTEELAQYTMQEGAFWGNIFTDDEPELFACTNKTNLANSYANLRFCSNGFPVADGSTISCGLLRNVGSCDNWCRGGAHQFYFNACGRWQEVLSVYLPPAH